MRNCARVNWKGNCWNCWNWSKRENQLVFEGRKNDCQSMAIMISQRWIAPLRFETFDYCIQLRSNCLQASRSITHSASFQTKTCAINSIPQSTGSPWNGKSHFGSGMQPTKSSTKQHCSKYETGKLMSIGQILVNRKLAPGFNSFR